MNAKQNFHQQDMEMFAMVNERTAARRKRREEMELACIEQGEPIVERRNVTLQAVAGTAARAGMVCLMIGGMTRGLIAPGYGVAMAALCALWAVGFWRRSRHGDR